jgi:hypothetical protein
MNWLHAGLLAGVAVAVTACGHPGVPAAVITASPTTSAHTHPSAHAHPAVPPPLLGVDLYAQDNYPQAVVKADGERMLAYIKNTLHADAVGIVWDYYMHTDSSDAVARTAGTLTPANVAILTRIAQADGLQVEYRPLIFVAGTALEVWEGHVRPAHPAAWFESYYRAERPYLVLAQQFRIREFVAETEMHFLNRSPLWGPFFARVGQLYHGTVSYAAWDGDYIKGHILPPQATGMDMYTPLRLPPSATVTQLLAAMQQKLHRAPPSLLRRTAIDETGIEARLGAYRNPPDLGHLGALDEQVQANWYLAICHLAEADHMRGVFFWKADLADNPAHPTQALSVFEGRKGAQAISECARILH